MASASMSIYVYPMKAGTCPCTTLPFSLQRDITAEQVSRYCTKPYPALSPVRLSLIILASGDEASGALLRDDLEVVGATGV